MGLSIGISRSKMTATERAKHQADILRSREIDEMNEQAHRKEMLVAKLLLLGAGESGKSTLFKQIIGLYGKGWPVNDRKKYREAVCGNIIQCMQALCRNSTILAERGHATSVLNENVADRDFVLDIPQGSTFLDPPTCEIFQKLWKDPGIQKTFELRSQYQLLDSAEYYLSKRMEDVGKPDYIPTEADVLRTRVKTTGIVETEFEIVDSKFRMFDVGGQRSERKKWINCFDDVTSIIFVAALSEYDQVLEEDGETNRMREALDLFNQICCTECLLNTAMILFLNKSDLFREKLKKTPITEFDPEFKGDDARDFDVAAHHIQDLFLKQNPNSKRAIYPHITCATDPSNVRHVFESVRDIVLRQCLQNGGLLP